MTTTAPPIVTTAAAVPCSSNISVVSSQSQSALVLVFSPSESSVVQVRSGAGLCNFTVFVRAEEEPEEEPEEQRYTCELEPGLDQKHQGPEASEGPAASGGASGGPAGAWYRCLLTALEPGTRYNVTVVSEKDGEKSRAELQTAPASCQRPAGGALLPQPVPVVASGPGRVDSVLVSLSDSEQVLRSFSVSGTETRGECDGAETWNCVRPER
ncbi:hypothetical protein WMY93_026937 [Mugilogobius chulae]|uniref:Fibronectin type-III domain-containing protein n=1 Tax=Mugilogobius chulae TaxID=88201 RepID=A0AAW0MYA4_9GOBI